MPELAYRHPTRGTAHRRRGSSPAFSACGQDLWDWDTIKQQVRGLATAVPVEQVDPADLCKRCWPECSEVYYGDFDPRTIAADAIDFGIPRRCERLRGHDGEHSRWLGRT